MGLPRPCPAAPLAAGLAFITSAYQQRMALQLGMFHQPRLLWLHVHEPRPMAGPAAGLGGHRPTHDRGA